MPRETAPAAETGQPRRAPGTPLATFRPTADNGPRWARSPCVPKCLPARSSLTMLPRSLTVPLCTVRIEHSAAPLARRAFSTSAGLLAGLPHMPVVSDCRRRAWEAILVPDSAGQELV